MRWPAALVCLGIDGMLWVVIFATCLTFCSGCSDGRTGTGAADVGAAGAAGVADTGIAVEGGATGQFGAVCDDQGVCMRVGPGQGVTCDENGCRVVDSPPRDDAGAQFAPDVGPDAPGQPVAADSGPGDVDSAQGPTEALCAPCDLGAVDETCPAGYACGGFGELGWCMPTCDGPATCGVLPSGVARECIEGAWDPFCDYAFDCEYPAVPVGDLCERNEQCPEDYFCRMESWDPTNICRQTCMQVGFCNVTGDSCYRCSATGEACAPNDPRTNYACPS